MRWGLQNGHSTTNCVFRNRIPQKESESTRSPTALQMRSKGNAMSCTSTILNLIPSYRVWENPKLCYYHIKLSLLLWWDRTKEPIVKALGNVSNPQQTAKLTVPITVTAATITPACRYYLHITMPLTPIHDRQTNILKFAAVPKSDIAKSDATAVGKIAPAPLRAIS